MRTPDSNRARRWYVVCTGLLAVAVLVQAAIAGQWLFGSADIVTHGLIGNGALVVAVGAALLALVSRVSVPVTLVAVAVPLLMVAQIGLGYVGRSTAAAASVHVPLGVTLFGLLVGNTVAARRPRRT